MDVVIEAFRSLPEKRLIVIGKGPERSRLREMASGNVRLVEGLSDAQMRWAYAHATALICASHEDFGLTPLEAGAHGVPTIALRAGGYLDTITEGRNGVFFDKVTPQSIQGGIQECADRGPWHRDEVKQAVAAFSEASFEDRLQGLASATHRSGQ